MSGDLYFTEEDASGTGGLHLAYPEERGKNRRRKIMAIALMRKNNGIPTHHFISPLKSIKEGCTQKIYEKKEERNR